MLHTYHKHCSDYCTWPSHFVHRNLSRQRPRCGCQSAVKPLKYPYTSLYQYKNPKLGGQKYGGQIMVQCLKALHSTYNPLVISIEEIALWIKPFWSRFNGSRILTKLSGCQCIYHQYCPFFCKTVQYLQYPSNIAHNFRQFFKMRNDKIKPISVFKLPVRFLIIFI